MDDRAPDDRRPLDDFVGDIDDLRALAEHEDYPRLAAALHAVISNIRQDPIGYAQRAPRLGRREG